MALLLILLQICLCSAKVLYQTPEYQRHQSISHGPQEEISNHHPQSYSYRMDTISSEEPNPVHLEPVVIYVPLQGFRQETHEDQNGEKVRFFVLKSPQVSLLLNTSLEEVKVNGTESPMMRNTSQEE